MTIAIIASLTVGGGVSQQLVHLLVGGVLSQGAHDVGNLVVSHFAVAHPVEQAEGLPVVCREEGREDIITFMKPASSHLSACLCL